jgi:hypothetical protein
VVALAWDGGEVEVDLLGVAMSMGEVLCIIKWRELLLAVVVVGVMVLSSSEVGDWREERGEDVAESSRSTQSS